MEFGAALWALCPSARGGGLRAGIPVGHSLDAEPIPAGARDPGRAGLAAHPEDPPPLCPFPELLKKTHFILIRLMTFPATLPKQIPCRELEEV